MEQILYNHYFEIDPEYFPVVDENVIRQKPDLWKKYYPHQTFVELLRDIIRVLNRSQKLSIWVEGAYGSGKSHSVLTLKKLLDANEEETTAYFDRYPQELGSDLRNSFLAAKSGGTILTVHRYGSSDIHNDRDLVFAVQNSITAALREAGISNMSENTLKSGTVQWLSKENNRVYFNSLIAEGYSNVFAGDTAETLLQKLQSYTDEKAIQELMRKISTVAHENGITAMELSLEGLQEWIKAVIHENGLKALFFIWDEFSDYFENVKTAISGFQGLAQLSATVPFYFVIVTHQGQAYFPGVNKIKDRFLDPIRIDLPENMAFLLTGAALEKNSDPAVREEWEGDGGIADDLYARTKDSRDMIKKRAKINDQELKNVLPIHPYTALMLKHMSSAFKTSGLRSMFDFIKNDRGEDVFSFQWFINHKGPEDDDPLLTADMLWDYFYIDGHDGLSGQVLSVLDRIKQPGVNQLDKNETRVFKTILLLQALGINVGDSVEVFATNKRNLGNAFEGSSLQPTKAVMIADKLVRDHLLMEKSVGNNQYVYIVPVGDADSDKIREKIDELTKDTTTARILDAANGYIANTLTLTGVLDKRYIKRHAGVSNFSSVLTQLRGQAAHSVGNTIPLMSVFAKNDNESASLKNYIDNALENGSSQIIFLDASLSPMGSDLFSQYIEARANEDYYTKIDATNAANYRKKAEDVLKKWRERIENGEFMLYTPENVQGERLTTLHAVYDALKTYDIACFHESPESMGNVIDQMWQANSLGQGATCGIENETKGTFRSANPNTKLENLIGEAWKLERYWEAKPYLPISKIKIEVEKLIQKGFDDNGRFAVRDVYHLLEAKPYGMFACNLTSFLMGFLLSEYADPRFTWYDGVTNAVMTKEKLKDTIVKVVQNGLTATEKGRVEYILTMTEEERAFHTLSSEAFNIPKERCSAIAETRRLVRKEMEGLYFPLWCVTYELPAGSCKTSMKVIDEVINAYQGLVNPGNIAGEKTEADLAKQIGTLRMKNPDLSDDLKRIITKNRCQEGMDAYLHDYRDGLLVQIATQINDGGKYIHCIRDKFDAQAANWVWHKDTVNQKINEVIRDYQIILESNDVLPKSTSFSGMLSEWQEKIRYFRVSFKTVRNYIGKMEPFCEMLYDLKKTGTLPENKRDDFLRELIASKEEFRVFAMDQLPVFRAACDYYLFDMNEDDCAQIYQKLPINCYTQEKSDYLKSVESAVKEYRGSQELKKLLNFWQEKTQTGNPLEWSEKYSMPILCMVDTREYDKAKKAFDTLNSKKPDKDAMTSAREFLETTRIFEQLNDNNARDKSFREKILKGREVLLVNLDEVKSELRHREYNISPYNWYGHPNIERCLNQMCDAKYQQVGYDKAIETINDMDPDEVKRYLKDLLKDNVTVGMEIIRSKQK